MRILNVITWLWIAIIELLILGILSYIMFLGGAAAYDIGGAWGYLGAFICWSTYLALAVLMFKSIAFNYKQAMTG